MAKNPPTQLLIIACELCGEKIPELRAHAWITAMDHALDFHRPQLLANPEYARRYFRLTNPLTGKGARLSSNSPQEPTLS